MASIRLVQKKGQPREDWSLWIEGRTLHSVQVVWGVGRNQTHERKVVCTSEDAARRALDDRVAELRAAGLVDRDAPAPAPKAALSKPRKPIKKPAWFAKLPEPLERQRKKLEARATRAGLAHRYDEIEALIRPGIDFSVKKGKEADVRGVVSRIGGTPDVPEDFAWPHHKKIPLQFIAQISLSELRKHDVEKVLPKSGLLLFFAQLEPGQAVGDDRYDSYGSIAHVELLANPKRTKGLTPKAMRRRPAEAALAAKGIGLLTPKGRLTLPYEEDPEIDALGLTEDEGDRYHDELFLGALPENPLHSLLGYGSAGTEHSVRGKRFLAQFDSDSRVGFEEGDHQTLRFYLNATSFTAHRFDSAVCTLEDA